MPSTIKGRAQPLTRPPARVVGPAEPDGTRQRGSSNKKNEKNAPVSCADASCDEIPALAQWRPVSARDFALIPLGLCARPSERPSVASASRKFAGGEEVRVA